MDTKPSYLLSIDQPSESMTGTFPLKGKQLNVFDPSTQRLESNTEMVDRLMKVLEDPESLENCLDGQGFYWFSEDKWFNYPEHVVKFDNFVPENQKCEEKLSNQMILGVSEDGDAFVVTNEINNEFHNVGEEHHRINRAQAYELVLWMLSHEKMFPQSAGDGWDCPKYGF